VGLDYRADDRSDVFQTQYYIRLLTLYGGTAAQMWRISCLSKYAMHIEQMLHCLGPERRLECSHQYIIYNKRLVYF
jgi:hypothetical protein